MKRPIALGALLLAGLVTVPSPGRAQVSLSLELHGGLGVPTGDFGDVSESGISLGVDVLVDLLPQIAAYGGYSTTSFDCVESPEQSCGLTDDFDSSGFSLGVRGILPLASNLHPWAGLGLVFHDMQLGVSEASGDTGFEIAVGVELELSHMIRFGPQVRYRSYSVTETLPDGTESSTDIGFYTMEIAGRIMFGG